jgi:hypothetical protein
MDDKIKGVIYKESYKKKDELVRNYARKRIAKMMIKTASGNVYSNGLLYEYLGDLGFPISDTLDYDKWCIDLIKDSIDIEDRRNCYVAIRMR